jgi:hypothetical protein
MRPTIDGNKVSTFKSFADELARALAAQANAPYEIGVEDAENMIRALDHVGPASHEHLATPPFDQCLHGFLEGGRQIDQEVHQEVRLAGLAHDEISVTLIDLTEGEQLLA